MTGDVVVDVEPEAGVEWLTSANAATIDYGFGRWEKTADS
jgi:hypothetical protein